MQIWNRTLEDLKQLIEILKCDVSRRSRLNLTRRIHNAKDFTEIHTSRIRSICPTKRLCTYNSVSRVSRSEKSIICPIKGSFGYDTFIGYVSINIPLNPAHIYFCGDSKFIRNYQVSNDPPPIQPKELTRLETDLMINETPYVDVYKRTYIE